MIVTLTIVWGGLAGLIIYAGRAEQAKNNPS